MFCWDKCDKWDKFVIQMTILSCHSDPAYRTGRPAGGIPFCLQAGSPVKLRMTNWVSEILPHSINRASSE